jgi:3-deoxy-manno-octulosonate cytidylyltransferase (CMP-KDO synthetase)
LAGTERCNEALQKLGKKFDIVVNIQGDEPLIEPEIIDGVVKALQASYFPCMFCLDEMFIHI